MPPPPASPPGRCNAATLARVCPALQSPHRLCHGPRRTLPVHPGPPTSSALDNIHAGIHRREYSHSALFVPICCALTAPYRPVYYSRHRRRAPTAAFSPTRPHSSEWPPAFLLAAHRRRHARPAPAAPPAAPPRRRSACLTPPPHRRSPHPPPSCPLSPRPRAWEAVPTFLSYCPTAMPSCPHRPRPRPRRAQPIRRPPQQAQPLQPRPPRHGCAPRLCTKQPVVPHQAP